MLPSEAFAAMGMPLCDLLKYTDLLNEDELAEIFTYGQMISIAGRAFHADTMLVHFFAALLARNSNGEDYDSSDREDDSHTAGNFYVIQYTSNW